MTDDKPTAPGSGPVGPFGRAARVYRSRGWLGTLPAKEGADSKKPQLSGWLGNSGGWPKAHHIDQWLTGFSNRNLLLRANPGTLLIDVDAYEGKQGGATLAELEAECGPLPATWRSSARADDPVSGIRWYRAEPPPGRRWKNEAGPGIELVHATLRYAAVPPSVNPKTGTRYRWYGPDGERATCPRPSQLPALPPAWLEALTRPEAPGRDETAPDTSRKFTEGQRGTAYGLAGLARELATLRRVWDDNVEAFNPQLNRSAFALGQLAAGGELDADHAVAELEDLLAELGAPADQFKTLRSGWTSGLANPRSAPGRAEQESREVSNLSRPVAGLGSPGNPPQRPAAVVGDDLAPLRAELLEALRRYQDLPDPGHVWVTLGAAATASSSEDPLWVMLVAPASSGKTETVRLTDKAAHVRLDNITQAGLLGWVKQDGKPAKGKKGDGGGGLVAGGALYRLPYWPGKPGKRRGLMTFGDLSTLLATSDRGGRDEVFSFLRRVYDGHATRSIAQPGGESNGQALIWSGRVTIIAACTKTIDNFSAHADALGPRWVYYRPTERDTQGLRRMARKARTPGVAELREQAQELATSLISLAESRVESVELSDAVYEAIEDAALVTGWGRGSVPRSAYGVREVLGVPDVEEPGRLVRQLAMLARGLLALGLDEPHAIALVRKCALDSMPEVRISVLRALATADKPLTTVALAKAASMSRRPAQRSAEDLELIGVVQADRIGPEPANEGDPDKRPYLWALAGEDGDLVRQVFRQALGEGWG